MSPSHTTASTNTSSPPLVFCLLYSRVYALQRERGETAKPPDSTRAATTFASSRRNDVRCRRISVAPRLACTCHAPRRYNIRTLRSTQYIITTSNIIRNHCLRPLRMRNHAYPPFRRPAASQQTDLTTYLAPGTSPSKHLSASLAKSWSSPPFSFPHRRRPLRRKRIAPSPCAITSFPYCDKCHGPTCKSFVCRPRPSLLLFGTTPARLPRSHVRPQTCMMHHSHVRLAHVHPGRPTCMCAASRHVARLCRRGTVRPGSRCDSGVGDLQPRLRANGGSSHY